MTCPQESLSRPNVSLGPQKGGEGVLTFAPDGDHTRVSVEGDARVTGVVARVGQRLLGTVSKTLMSQFFACMGDKVESST